MTSARRRVVEHLARALSCALVLISCRAAAEEPLFGFVYTTDLLPGGKYEVAQWLTWRTGKPVGRFDVLEGRSEFEYGISDRLQVAAYLNYEWARAYHDNVITGATLPPASLANVNVGPDDRLDTVRFTGGSLEGILRVFSPYTKPVGLALYVRPSIGPQFRELEARLILQMNFLDDRFVVAWNVAATAGWRYLPGVAGMRDSNGFDRPWDEQSTLAFGLASSYRFAAGWSAGVELQNERGYSDVDPFNASSRTNVAYYLGPTLHYADRHMFATLSFLTQLPVASDYAHTDPDFVVGGRNYGAGFERLRLRFKIGRYF